jgi:hypothetical protein
MSSHRPKEATARDLAGRFRLEHAARPRKGTITSQGRPRTVFARALQTANLVVADRLAHELGRISVAKALEQTILIARKEPRRLPTVAVRWLERYLQECEPGLPDG